MEEDVAPPTHPVDREVLETGMLLGRMLHGLTSAVRQAHEQVSATIDAVAPAAARPWRVASAAAPVPRSAYAAVERLANTLPVGAAAAVTRLGHAERVAPSQTARGRAAVATVSGLWPHSLSGLPALEVTMAVRVGHRDVALTAASLADAFPQARGHLVVFVHGMAMDESCWQRPGVGSTGSESYGARLERHHDLTPVFVRYPTGRGVGVNGEALCALLADLEAAWPTPVTRIDLVGHSMGGLVTIAAAEHATATGAAWGSRLGSLTTLGTPHHGVRLAQLIGDTGRRLAATPGVGPVAEWMRVRSDGGADLRIGHADPDAPSGLGCPVIAVSATGRPGWWREGHDGLVPVASADASRITGFAVERVYVDHAGHLDLLNHPDVNALLARRVTDET